MSEKEIVQELKEAITLIENSANHPVIQKKLTDFGLTPKVLKEGQALAGQLTQLQRQIKTMYGYQYEATQALKTDYAALRAVYEEHLTLARLVCKDQPGLQTSLGLNGPRANRRALWTEQVASFYEKLSQQPQLLERYGITPAGIEQALAMVMAFQEAQRIQTKKIGEAQRNTRHRNEARIRLKRWVKAFKSVAYAALQDDKELLETLGIVVPSR